MNNDLELYKKKFKENINILVNQNRLEDSKELLSQYESIIKDDVEIYSIKGVIAMLEGNMDEAESVLKEGLIRYKDNFDILYNLGYLYQSIDNKSDSALYYGCAYKYSKDENLKNELYESYDTNKTLKDIFISAANSSNKRFIILSSCGWGDVYQRMHHLSRSLVKFGNEVVYVTPTTTVNINSENIGLHTLTEYSLKNFKTVDGVKIYSPISTIYNEKMIANNYTHLIQNLLNMPNDANKTIIVTYMPYQIETIRSLKGDYMHIYDCVDDHSDLKYAFWANKKDIVWEQELMDEADAITTTATSLYLERIAIEGRKNIYLSKNAVNEGDFSIGDEEIPDDLKNIPEPRIVYTGAIYDWFDKELFYDVVKSNPDKSFVIIGFGNDQILNERCNNLYLLGAKKHSELKKYLKCCQVGIIPFRDDIDLIVNCDPIKQYEYIACGLPVVTTFMPESAIDKINTFLANTKESFNSAIEKCLNLGINKELVKNFVVENSWNSRAVLLCNITDDEINEEKTTNSITDIGKKLFDICHKYNSPIFETLKAMSFNLKDSEEFEKYSKQAYDKGTCRFVEKQYLVALLKNNNITTFVDVVKNSKYINKEIKEELFYVKKLKNKQLIRIILYLCIGKIRESIVFIDKLHDYNFKNLYTLYIRFLLGEEIEYSEIESIGSKAKYSQIFNFLIEEKSIMKKSITVLIPTKDRPELLERCVKYFCNISDKNLHIEVFILDASNSKNLSINKQMLQINDKTVKYFSFDENSSHFSRILRIYNQIKTEFCCLCADDDFIHRDGIIKSIEMLSQNTDIITVKGKSYIFLNNDTSNIYYFPKDSCLPLIEGQPMQRLDKLISNWVPQLYYLVYRKNDFYEIIDFIKNNKNNVDSSVFAEYLLYFLVPLCGKVVNIEQPLNIRDESSYSAGYIVPGFYQHAINGDFNEHYKNFKEKLLDFCKKKNINVKDDDIDNIFSDFLANSWGVEKKYIKIMKESEYSNKTTSTIYSAFDIDLLKKGFGVANSKNINTNLKPYQHVFFEICGKCNARCKWCVTGNNNINSKQKGSIVNIQDFERAIIYMKNNSIIDDNTIISLFNWGEPFLHPQFEEIVEFLDKENIYFALSTNASKTLNLSKKGVFKNLSFITFSMPGFSQKSYDKIHGFNFEKIKRNILQTLETLKNGGFRGRAIIAFHVYQFNMDEIPLAVEFAKTNNLHIECSFAYINDYERGKKYLESKIDYEELKQMGQELILYPYQNARNESNENFICPQYDYLTINEKLNIELCCVVQQEIGNILEMDLEKIRMLKTSNKECNECHRLNIDYIVHNPIVLKTE